jgi:ferredoxin
MADPNKKIPSNVPGTYYVDFECIDCDVCRETAPATFQRDDELGYSRVVRQPSSAVEVSLAEEALRGCPADAIGKDGI